MDKFYTNKHLSKIVRNIAFTRGGLLNFVEPSAGNGSISLLFDEITAYDIKPEHDSIIKKDWFDVKELPNDCCVVGNPPFGKRSNLAVDFINHAFEIGATYVVFVLPQVFNKYSIQSRITNDAFLSLSIDAPENCFTLEGKPYHVPCCVQVWQRDLRKTKPVVISKYFRFTSPLEADFFMFGAGGKTIPVEDVTPTNRGYYIKGDKDLFDKIDWKGYSSVSGGVSWLTKGEVVEKVNNFIERE